MDKVLAKLHRFPLAWLAGVRREVATRWVGTGARQGWRCSLDDGNLHTCHEGNANGCSGFGPNGPGVKVLVRRRERGGIGLLRCS
jgi:hypothetical protein